MYIIKYMGFLDSLILCLIYIIIASLIIIAGFCYFFGSDDHIIDQQILISHNLTNYDIEDNDIILRKRRKWIGLFVLCAIITIMTTSSINAFMNMKT